MSLETLPVNIERSNFASEEHSTSRTSAGSLLPALINSTSPGTTSGAIMVCCVPSRSKRQLSGNIVVIEAITREDDQSCQALNAACTTNTTKRTMARARLADDGSGSPSGFHETKTSILPVNKIDPNPPNRYSKIFLAMLEGGAEGTLRPNCAKAFLTCSAPSP